MSRLPPCEAPAAGGVSGGTDIILAGVRFTALPSGALWASEEGALIVADLHLEKASSFAASSQLPPPYDSAATLARLAALLDEFAPRLVASLGDAWHDASACRRMAAPTVRRLVDLCARSRWVWVAGNHDPAPPDGFGGEVVEAWRIGPVVLRHQPGGGGEACVGEVWGHFHPVARVAGRRGVVRTKCFVHDGARLVLPAFGAFTGGLNVLDPAIAGLFGGPVHTLAAGPRRVHPLRADALTPDRATAPRRLQRRPISAAAAPKTPPSRTARAP